MCTATIRLTQAAHSAIILMRCSGPQPSRDTTQPIAAIRSSSALSDIVDDGDCNTPVTVIGRINRPVSAAHVTSRCYRLVSPVGVTGSCHRSVLPARVTGRCYRPVSPVGVTGPCHQSVLTARVTGRCYRPV